MTLTKTRFTLRTSLAVLLLTTCTSSPAALRPTPKLPHSVATPPDSFEARATDTRKRIASGHRARRLAWSDANLAAFRDVLGDRAAHGLDRITFLPPSIDDAATAGRDAALTRSALRYATALASGAVDPKSLHALYDIPRPQPNLRAGLAVALSQGQLREWFAGLAPQGEEYRKLSKAYLTFRQDAQDSATPTITVSGPLRPGDHDDRMDAIVQQLTAGEYLGDPSTNGALPSDPTVYGEPLVTAVKALQRDYGIVEDGIIGEKTLAILNLRPGDRARALAVAMDRRRWLSRTPPLTRIDVNVAAARLSYYRNGTLVDERRVIAGQPGKETPPLLAPIYRLVANPTWTIPKSIQHGEMAHVGAAYLRQHDMVLRNGWIVQQPGPHNALGMVKFDMKDDQAIYLHDTSNRALFARSQRHLSHGCVRVEDAPGFAERLADDEGIGERWRAAQASGQHRFVPLPHQISVRLLYHNVFVDQHGGLAFRTDPYDWNPAVATALGFDEGTHMKAKAEPIDVGP